MPERLFARSLEAGPTCSKYVIELESVHRTFLEGDRFDMTLTFERAGTVEIEVEIEPLEEHEHQEAEDDDIS